jgi:hypothetical protein
LTNTEKTKKALSNIREAANGLSDIDEQTRGWIIREILRYQNIPMLNLATPVILSLASSKNLALIAKTVDKMLLDLIF